MSATTDATPATDSPTGAVGEAQADELPSTPTDTAAEQGTEPRPEVDWKARSREWEKRAKANADAAKRVAELEESVEKLATVRGELAEAQLELARYRVCAEAGVQFDEVRAFLTGTDEETLREQVAQVSTLLQAANASGPGYRSRSGNYVPAEGSQPTPPAPDPMREIARQVFDGPQPHY